MTRSPHCFEDLQVGMSVTAKRTFSRADIETFRVLAPDDAPVHRNPLVAAEMGYKDILVFGWLAGAPFSGLLGMELPGPATVLHSVRIGMAAPIYPGDELTYRVEVKQLVTALKAVVLDLTAHRVSDNEIVIRGQAQCGFRV